MRQSGFRGPAAGKTGTTNDGTDTWFIGYTPEVVAAVWIGFDKPRPIMSVATGGRVAAPVWARLMTRYYSAGAAEDRYSGAERDAGRDAYLGRDAVTDAGPTGAGKLASSRGGSLGWMPPATRAFGARSGAFPLSVAPGFTPARPA